MGCDASKEAPVTGGESVDITETQRQADVEAAAATQRQNGEAQRAKEARQAEAEAAEKEAQRAKDAQRAEEARKAKEAQQAEEAQQAALRKSEELEQGKGNGGSQGGEREGDESGEGRESGEGEILEKVEENKVHFGTLKKALNNITDIEKLKKKEQAEHDPQQLETALESFKTNFVDIDYDFLATNLEKIFKQPGLTRQYFKIIAEPAHLEVPEFGGRVKELFGDNGWNIIESESTCVNSASLAEHDDRIMTAFTKNSGGENYSNGVTGLCHDLHDGIDATGDERFVAIMNQLHTIAIENLS